MLKKIVFIMIILLLLTGCGSEDNDIKPVSSAPPAVLKSELIKLVENGTVENLDVKYHRYLDEPLWNGESAIFYYFLKKDFDGILKMKGYGVDINILDSAGYSLVDLAVDANDTEGLAFLLENGGYVYETDDEGRFHAHVYFINGAYDIFSIFTRNGFDFSTKDHKGFSIMKFILQERRFDLFVDYFSSPEDWNYLRGQRELGAILTQFENRRYDIPLDEWGRSTRYLNSDDLDFLVTDAQKEFDTQLFEKAAKEEVDLFRLWDRSKEASFVNGYFQKIIGRDLDTFPVEKYGSFLFSLIDAGLDIYSIAPPIAEVIQKAYDSDSPAMLLLLVEDSILYNSMDDNEIDAAIVSAVSTYDTEKITSLTDFGIDIYTRYRAMRQKGDDLQGLPGMDLLIHDFVGGFFKKNDSLSSAQVRGFADLLFYFIDEGAEIHFFNAASSSIVKQWHAGRDYAGIAAAAEKVKVFKREQGRDRQLQTVIRDAIYSYDVDAVKAMILWDADIFEDRGYNNGNYDELFPEFIRSITDKNVKAESYNDFGEVLFLLIGYAHSTVNYHFYANEYDKVFGDSSIADIVMKAYKEDDSLLLEPLYEVVEANKINSYRRGVFTKYFRRPGGPKELEDPIYMDDLYTGDRYGDFEVITSYNKVLNKETFFIAFSNGRINAYGDYSARGYGADQIIVIKLINTLSPEVWLKKPFEDFQEHHSGNKLLDNEFIIQGDSRFVPGAVGSFSGVITGFDATFSPVNIASTVQIKITSVTTNGGIKVDDTPLLDAPGGASIKVLPAKYFVEVLSVSDEPVVIENGAGEQYWVEVQSMSESETFTGWVLNTQINYYPGP